MDILKRFVKENQEYKSRFKIEEFINEIDINWNNCYFNQKNLIVDRMLNVSIVFLLIFVSSPNVS